MSFVSASLHSLLLALYRSIWCNKLCNNEIKKNLNIAYFICHDSISSRHPHLLTVAYAISVEVVGSYLTYILRSLLSKETILTNSKYKLAARRVMNRNWSVTVFRCRGLVKIYLKMRFMTRSSKLA